MSKSAFAKEADLCAAFVAALPKEWQAYPETGEFDILLVRKADGFQIGVEAKLKLNAKVLTQALEGRASYQLTGAGPDCRAVLVPDAARKSDLAALCPYLGITIIGVYDPASHYWRSNAFYPYLPGRDGLLDSEWHECAPAQRLAVPDYVPDVEAGVAAPVKLTPWKVKAIRIAVTLDRRGFVTREDFRFHQINMQRWRAERWLTLDGAVWVRGPYFPDLRRQHPTNYAQIEADFDRWAPPAKPKPAKQEAML